MALILHMAGVRHVQDVRPNRAADFMGRHVLVLLDYIIYSGHDIHVTNVLTFF